MRCGRAGCDALRFGGRQDFPDRFQNFSLMTWLPQNRRHGGKRVKILRVETRHENNRSVGGRVVLPQLPYNGISVEDWHYEIEQNGIRVYLAGQLVGFEPVGRRRDTIARAYRYAQKCQMIDVVVNDQHEPPTVRGLSSQDGRSAWPIGRLRPV